jgi:transcriptional regulator of acetoin/glycerol metabolism
VLEQAVAFAEGVKLDREAIDRLVDAVIASREGSLANRRAVRQDADGEQHVRLLGSCRGNVAEVARQLGMTRVDRYPPHKSRKPHAAWPPRACTIDVVL